MPVLSTIVNYWRGTPSPPAADPAVPYPKSHQEAAHVADNIQNDDQEEMKTRNSKIIGTDCAVPPDCAVSEDQSASITTSTEEVQRADDSNGIVDTAEKQIITPNEIGSDGSSASEDAEVTKITNTMEEVEKAIQEETKKEQEQIVYEGEKEWKSVEDNQRYRRLQHLLDKSGIYCKFLLERMESQKIEAAKRNERLSKKQEKEQNEKNNAVQQVPQIEKRVTRRAQGKGKSSGGPPETQVKTSLKKAGQGRRRKADDSSYMISEYIDKESLSKRQKLSEEGSWTDYADGDTESSNCLQCVPEITDEQAKTNGSSSSDHESQNHSLPTIQPKFLTGGTLRRYQLQGLTWLKVLYENGMNGILADEMGLGKTIQCISMLAHLIEMGVKGPYLVAAPLSTLPNWITEFNKFAPKIPVVLYHGSIEDRLRMRYKLTKLKLVEGNVYTYPVVITSYEICMRDQKSMHHLDWKYIIVDEGHRIKNLNCKLIRELKTYRAANRLLLTGTPLQNNLSELWSLLNFLLPDIFDDLESFQKWFDFSAINEEDGNERIIAQEREHQVLQRLHAILTPFLLRRLKVDVELALPPKKEVLVYAPLTKKQELFYKTTLDKTIVEMFKDQEKETEAPVELSSTGRPKRKGRKDMNYKLFFKDNIDEEELNELGSLQSDFCMSSTGAYKTTPSSFLSLQMRNICMQLRKCCNHPYLLECPLDQASMLSKIDEELVTSSGKLLLLDRMLPALKQGGHKVLLFSQMTRMMDILEDYCILRKYDYSRLDGTMKISDRQSEIEKFNTDPNVFVFILSTRAGGLGINLAKADTVIIYDSDWNPQVDLQAQDRCHRIGQTQPVVVYRLVTANTVDQRVVERAATKRKLEKMIMHKGKFKGKQDTSVLDVKELRDLLESGYHDKVVSSEGLVISDDELKALLDRSDLLAHGKKRRQTTSKESNAKSSLFKVLERPAQP